MPIRGNRKLYKIPEIQVGEDALGAGGRAIVVKMKEPIGDFLGLTQMSYNDPAFIGTYAGAGPNAGYKFIKRVGGFRESSFRVVAKTQFTIAEIVRKPDGSYAPENKTFKSFSIGFPGGVTVREFIAWITGRGVNTQIDYIVTPSGVSHPIGGNEI